jgi:ArsR family transcriptional regulator, arsenate/arsenite/antimonite-responsive transcriptional repressor
MNDEWTPALMDDTRTATIAKALAHPVRVRILRLLAEQSECRGADMFRELPLAQSTVSQHLAILREAGVIVSHSVGQASVYCLAPDVLQLFSAEVSAIASTPPTCSPDSEECR